MSALGWIDDDGEWHLFPPLPVWEPTPIFEGDWFRCWDETAKKYKRRKAVPDPMPLFRLTEKGL